MATDVVDASKDSHRNTDKTNLGEVSRLEEVCHEVQEIRQAFKSHALTKASVETTSSMCCELSAELVSLRSRLDEEAGTWRQELGRLSKRLEETLAAPISSRVGNLEASTGKLQERVAEFHEALSYATTRAVQASMQAMEGSLNQLRSDMRVSNESVRDACRCADQMQQKLDIGNASIEKRISDLELLSARKAEMPLAQGLDDQAVSRLERSESKLEILEKASQDVMLMMQRLHQNMADVAVHSDLEQLQDSVLSKTRLLLHGMSERLENKVSEVQKLGSHLEDPVRQAQGDVRSLRCSSSPPSPRELVVECTPTQDGCVGSLRQNVFESEGIKVTLSCRASPEDNEMSCGVEETPCSHDEFLGVLNAAASPSRLPTSTRADPRTDGDHMQATTSSPSTASPILLSNAGNAKLASVLGASSMNWTPERCHTQAECPRPARPTSARSHKLSTSQRSTTSTRPSTASGVRSEVMQVPSWALPDRTVLPNNEVLCRSSSRIHRPTAGTCERLASLPSLNAGSAQSPPRRRGEQHHSTESCDDRHHHSGEQHHEVDDIQQSSPRTAQLAPVPPPLPRPQTGHRAAPSALPHMAVSGRAANAAMALLSLAEAVATEELPVPPGMRETDQGRQHCSEAAPPVSMEVPRTMLVRQLRNAMSPELGRAGSG